MQMYKFFVVLVGCFLLQPGLATETENAVDIQIGTAMAKVGEPTQLEIKITPKTGFKISRAYRNRIFELSAAEDGLVEFDQGLVRGEVEHDALIFAVSVTPQKAGEHPINGIIRFSFHDGHTMDTKSVPLITTVTGTE